LESPSEYEDKEDKEHQQQSEWSILKKRSKNVRTFCLGYGETEQDLIWMDEKQERKKKLRGRFCMATLRARSRVIQAYLEIDTGEQNSDFREVVHFHPNRGVFCFEMRKSSKKLPVWFCA
jgi:hypothetical protein